MDARVRASR
jgi:hypothetical protein